MVKKADIARALSVSASLITRYSRRGMPTSSVAAARSWLDANIDPVRRVAQEWGKRHAASQPPSALAARANELGRQAVNDFERFEHALRAVLREVARFHDERLRSLVRLDEHVWDQLLEFGGTADECDRGEISLAEFDDPDETAYLWTAICRPTK